MYQRTATLEPAPASRSLVVGIVVWLSVALVVASTDMMIAFRPLVAVMVFGAIAAGVVVYRRGGALRELADRIDLRVPILIHLVRAAIGVQILITTEAGIIPALFGHRAGPGDIAIGVLALGAALCVPATSALRRRAIAAWCVLGIVDLVIAFSTGQYLIFVLDDPRMTLIGKLPWSLLPTIVVPLMILSHLLVLARLRRGA